MAVAMASVGGVGIIHYNNTLEEQLHQVGVGRGGEGGSFTFGELHLVGVVGGRTVGVESGMWVVWQAGHGVWRRAGF